MFNCSERKLCRKCSFPEGFCKHTIEEEFKETCPDTPLTKKGVWQLVRSYAIAEKQKRNLMHFESEDLKESKNKIEYLEEQNKELLKDNDELKAFKKHIKDVLRNTSTK